MKKITLITVILLIANLLSAQWIQQNPYYPNSGTLNDIFFIDQDYGWVVGGGSWGSNSFYTNDGGITWNWMSVYGFMNSIYFTDQNKGWVVGNDGIIQHTVDGGENWEYQESTTDFNLQSVFFVDSLNGWIAGKLNYAWPSFYKYIILHTNDGGITWDEQPSNWGGESASLDDIFFINDTTGWATGLIWGPGILFTNDGGNTWIQLTSYGGGTSIYFKDESNGWYAGSGIYHTSDGGVTWVQQFEGGYGDIAFVDSLNGWAVGYEGEILNTVDGGENWEIQDSGTTLDLMGVCAVDAEKCWICGENSMILYGPTEKVSADLYVSPTGNNNNSGLTPDEPLRNIYSATSLILADSNNPHTIYLAEGTYGSANNEIFPILLPNHISLVGATIEGVFLVTAGTPAIKIDNTVNNGISYLTITGGSSSGAIICENSEPLLENLRITGSSGCGIYCSNANPMIYFSDMSGNSESGIDCSYSDADVQHCDITSNAGSGINCSYSNPNVQDCNISGNLISGIYCTFSNPVIQDVYVTGNSAGSSFVGNDGGGIWLKNSNPTIRNSYIVNNTAQDDGGGIYLWMSNPIIQNVIISENSAADQGSGVYCWNSHPLIYNSTITGNLAGTDGGGLHSYESSIEIINSILWGNSPQEIFLDEQSYYSTSIEISYSDIQGGEAGIVTNGNVTINWLEGNINEDPLFEVSGDHPYMLSNESPCVNTGTPDTTGLNLPELDLAGNPRFYGGRIDMGAYENQEVVVTTKKTIHQLLSTDIEIYPNPARNELTINYELNKSAIVNINLINMQGKQYKALNKESNAIGKQTEKLDISHLPQGIYFVRMQEGNKIITKKIIKTQ